MFVSNQALLPEIDELIERKKKLLKAKDTYGYIYDRVKQLQRQQRDRALAPTDDGSDLREHAAPSTSKTESHSSALVPVQGKGGDSQFSGGNMQLAISNGEQMTLQPKKAPSIPKPKWHAPWKLYRVISGHLGWVRCVAVEPGNEWFATGAADRVIKIWDLASGKLKLSLTGKAFVCMEMMVQQRL